MDPQSTARPYRPAPDLPDVREVEQLNIGAGALHGSGSFTRVIKVAVALSGQEAKAFDDLIRGEGRVQIVCTMTSAQGLLAEVDRHGADLVVVGADVSGYSPELVAELVRWPRRPLAVVGIVPAIGEWRNNFTQAGGTAFFHGPVTTGLVTKLVEQLDALVDTARERWQPAELPAAVDEFVLPRPTPPARHEAALSSRAFRAEVITVWGGKGGDGKTTMAVNVACALAYLAQLNVLLIDADMNCGRVAIHIPERPDGRTLLNLAIDYENLKAGSPDGELDLSMIRRRVARVDTALRMGKSKGSLDVLFGIQDMRAGPQRQLSGKAGSAFMRELFEVARRHYDYVVVDSGSNITQVPHAGALRYSDRILFMNSSDLSSLFFNRATMRALIADAKIPAERFQLVVNRFHPSDRIEKNEIPAYLDDLPLAAVIPEDPSRAVTASINDRRPFILDHIGKNPPEVEAVVRAMLELTVHVHPAFEAFVKKRYEKPNLFRLFQKGR